MSPVVLPDRNYGFACEACSVGIELFELLRRWEDL
jgi:hypothetical protein